MVGSGPTNNSKCVCVAGGGGRGGGGAKHSIFLHFLSNIESNNKISRVK